MAEISEKVKVARKKYAENLPAVSIAIAEEKIEIIDELLSQSSDLQIDLSNHKDAALFYVTCISGTVDLLKKFIDSGFPVDSPLKTIPEALPPLQNYLGLTGLHLAFKYHRLGAVQFLLNQGASIFISDDQGTTPLHVLFETKKQALQKQSSLVSYDQIIDIVLQSNEQKSDKMGGNEVSHFHIACTRDMPETIQNYLQNGACIDQTVGTFPGHEGFSALHFAVKYECVKVVEFLLKNGANVSLVDHNNRTALHLAELPELALLLLHHATNLTLRDSNGNTPLHKAFEEKNLKIMHSLLSLVNDNENPKNVASHHYTADIKNNENVAQSPLKNIVSDDIYLPSRIEIEYEDVPKEDGADDKNLHEPPIKAIKIDFCVDQSKDSLNQENETEDLVDNNSSLLKDCYTKFCHKCDDTTSPENSDTNCQVCSTLIRHQCNRCFKIFFKHQAIIDHLNTSCKMNKYFFNCTECSYRAKTQLKVYNHWTEKHAKSDFKSDGLTLKQRMSRVTRRKEGKTSSDSGKRNLVKNASQDSMTSVGSEETVAETTKKVPFCRTRNCMQCPHTSLPSNSRKQ